MIKYNTCGQCQFPNPITSERQVFCVNCNKVLNNNFVDWKKKNVNLTFSDYVEQFVSSSKPIIKEKKPIAKNTKIFLISSILQVVLFLGILSSQHLSLFWEENFQNKPYLSEIDWKNKTINNWFKITTPFELKSSGTALPISITSNVNKFNSYRAESSCQSFSITLEELDLNKYNILTDDHLISIVDSYMMQSREDFELNRHLEHYNIKNYHTYLQHGFYSLDNKKYIYDNYTLVSKNKAYKIIISYLQDDELLHHMAESISQSILNNGIIS